MRRAEGRLAFADMHLPDTPPRALYGWVKELWQGALPILLRVALPIC